MQLLSFIYTELVIANKEGIPDFEEFIHVTTARHVAFSCCKWTLLQDSPGGGISLKNGIRRLE